MKKIQIMKEMSQYIPTNLQKFAGIYKTESEGSICEYKGHDFVAGECIHCHTPATEND